MFDLWYDSAHRHILVDASPPITNFFLEYLYNTNVSQMGKACMTQEIKQILIMKIFKYFVYGLAECHRWFVGPAPT